MKDNNKICNKSQKTYNNSDNKNRNCAGKRVDVISVDQLVKSLTLNPYLYA
jgi:hypothetical protein